jgi:hypothetical protein
MRRLPAAPGGFGPTVKTRIEQPGTSTMRPRYTTAGPRLTATAILTLLGGTLAGCGGTIVGDWHMVQTVPNEDIFAIDDAHFHRDGSFAAMITIEGRTAREVGSYHFNGFKLTLRPQAGGQRRYDAMVKLGKLEISGSGRKVVLKKGKKHKQDESQTEQEAANP